MSGKHPQKNGLPKPLAVSDRIYQTLLIAYPAEHRREYGPLMAQVFRDMCQDVYDKSGALGLISLWPRALIDAALTAATEHLDKKGCVLVTNILETQGLMPALEDFVTHWKERSSHVENAASLAVHLTAEGEIPRLGEQAEAAVFDVVQESVANAIAHARADNIWIALSCQDDDFDLSIRDDGQGFDWEAMRAERALRGLPVGFSAQDRVEAMQGTCFIASAPGEGTIVHVVVPLSS
ncbi:MAG: hypothetical protein JXA89_08220 [Anaerolineae bacterium]|nr:hypothetical protein [Anaerolineae bacterium]